MALALGDANADRVGDPINAFYIYATPGTVLQNLGTFTAPGGGSIFSENNVAGRQITVTAASTGVFGFPLHLTALNLSTYPKTQISAASP
jgi:hypothetical protein